MNTQPILYQLLPDEVLWKILVDVSDELLLIEKRNLQTLQVYFEVLDLHSGDILLKNFHTWESWWISAVWVHKQKIVFSLYEQENTPIGRGIVVFDICNQNMLWQNLELNFFGASRNENCIFLRKNTESSLTQAYSLETGTPTDLSNALNEENLLGYRLASTYPVKSAFYQDLQTFIYQKTQQKTFLPIHYTETPTHICIGYGIEFEEKFAYFLLITDIAGNIEFAQEVSTKPDTCFFVHQSCVIVFHSKEVCVYSLKNKTL